jgi:MFS family permease
VNLFRTVVYPTDQRTLRAAPPYPGRRVEPAGTAPPLLVVFTLWLLVFSSEQPDHDHRADPAAGRRRVWASGRALGTLVSAYSIMVGIFAVISGPFSDRSGGAASC